MAKKRGLASNRGLDALLGSIKKEKLIAGSLANTSVTVDPQTSVPSDDNQPPKASAKNLPDNQPSNSTPTDNTPSQPTSTQTKPASTSKTSPTATVTAKSKVADISMSDNAAALAEINLLHIDVNRLQRGKYQPRIGLGEEALQELATSIRQHGVMQPIVIRPLRKPAKDSTVTHEIIAGERRWRAAQIAGLTHIPAIIRPISDDLAIALALIENIQREDLSVMEQAVALQRFHDEFGMSHAQIADVVGKARTTVSNLLRLNGLHDDVKTALNDGLMDMGHARALLALSAEQQPVIAKKIANEQLTVRQTEQLVKDILDPKQAPKTAKELDYERLRLNQQLSERLGAVVKVKGSSSGKGSIEIFFHNADELQALLSQLKSEDE